MLAAIRRSRPTALLVLAAFLWSMAPRSYARADQKASTAPAPKPESEVQPVAVAEGTTNASSSARVHTVSGASSFAHDFKQSLPSVNPGETTVQSLPLGEANKSGVGSQAIALPDGSGTISGMGESFSAQASTGLATFAVPFSLPKARGGVQPALGLGYSSSAGSGNAGLGWSAGTPAIARQTDRGLPAYDDQTAWHARQDRFIFNGGQELIPICMVSGGACPGAISGEAMPLWAEGWQYFRPRIEGAYARFFWNPSQRLWRVQGKDGSILELGVVDGEEDALESDPDNPLHVYQWNLKRQLDAYGNQVVYKYETRPGEAFANLTDIFDTPPVVLPNSDPTRASWAHRVRLRYEDRPDPSVSYRRGWRSVQARRLVGVDVLSKGEEVAAPRELQRSYRLRYDSQLRASLLVSVQAEGRCTPAKSEDDPNPSGCPALPELTFEYTHVPGSIQDQFEPLTSSVVAMGSTSPDRSLDEDYTDLYDVNSDGLPDVVSMMPAFYGGEHALWLNGEKGIADQFGPQQKMGLSGNLAGANATVLTKHNPNVVALDVDGDGTINLVHMPKAKTYNSFVPRKEGSKWNWHGLDPVTTTDGLDARIDLSADAPRLRVVDVNGDGLVDVLKSAGTSYLTWFSLGRWQGGYGLFGHVEWVNGAPELSLEPVERCVPWAGQAQEFTNGDVSIADMNGDGLADIVRLRQGDMKYWPGRGDGSFGTGPLGCPGSSFGENTYVQVSNSPFYTDPQDTALRLGDINGDGLADLVHVRMNAVDVWLNINGLSFTDRQVLPGAPINAAHTNRVRIADMNGSGTADVVWGDGGNYKYMDLAGGVRPWLLTRVYNGLGKRTEIKYATTTAQMLQATASGNAWTSVSPVVMPVVSSVVVSDQLSELGWEEGQYETRYTYRNPVFDGLQREFRGFRNTVVTSVGDANSATAISDSEFLLGERPSCTPSCFPVGPQVDYQDTREAWRDNPKEALKGLTRKTATRSESGLYLSSTLTSYRLRRLYEGLDGRSVWVAFAHGQDSLLYDTSDTSPPQAPVPVTDALQIDDRGTLVETSSESIEEKGAHTGMRHLAQRSEVDLFGNTLVTQDLGVVGVDETLVAHSTFLVVPAVDVVLGEGNWAWRTIESWVEGPGDQKRKLSRASYNSHGALSKTEVMLEGAGSLLRAALGTGAPATASVNGWITTKRAVYDNYGNPVLEVAAGDQCRSVVYDTDFGQLPISETLYVGAPGGVFTLPDSSEAQCGSLGLVTTGEFDRGLQSPRRVVGPNGEVSRAERDAFGRVTRLYRPDAQNPTQPSAVPHKIVEYALPEETGHNISRIHTMELDGATDTDAQYHEGWSFIDGLGRTLISFSEADPDPTLGDGFEWVVSGRVEYNKKGAVYRKYLPWAWNGSPLAFPSGVSQPADLRFGEVRYDAFGRATKTIGLDGVPQSRTRYHALSVDRWDAEDLSPGSHHATYATEEKDGHGRVVRVTERVRVAGDIEERHVRLVYLSTGEPAAILRERGAEQVTRTFGYDTLGRMVLNQEPNAGTWRYVYSDAGALVGTSDGRGCGVNFGYDTAGRLVTEDYSPCEAHHEAYDAEPEVEYLFDFADPDAEEAFPGAGQSFTLGRMTSARDRASKVLSRTDVLGRVLEVAKKVATPDGMLGTQWFRRQVAYDGAGRPIVETTGATVNLADTLDSAVWTTYTKRGAVKQVGSTYGLLVDHVRRNAEGLTEEIGYGDGAATTTAFLYDELRRPHAVTTFRAKLSSWNEPGHYTQQLLLQDEEFTYDRVGNPTQIRDWRVAEEWPTGAKPVTRTMTYDDLYRLTQVSLDYGGAADTWSDPFGAEAQNPGEIERPQPAPRGDFGGAGRPLQQSWTYDWLGNTASMDDDLQAFYDRSLGTIQNTGYQLTSATITSGTRSGNLNAQYDASGNLIALNVHRDGPCIPAGLCTDQHYVYEWDEVGRLAKAQRSDGPDVAVTLEYAYDGSDHRVRKSAVLPGGESRHNVYVFGSLELRMAEFGSEYEVSERTEVPYLRGHGVRLGRVVHTAAPDTLEPTTRVFLELGDHLGSTSVVLDRTTGELVERTTAYAYGPVESDWRPGRWSEFREDYRFTGKEDDIQVGLTYFGKRYYAPYLGRWISADPLGVHSAGEADPNLYAYVHGRVYAAVDPVGLEIVTVIAAAVAIGAAYGAASNIAAQAVDGREWSTKSFLLSTLAAGVAAGIAAGFGGAGFQVAGYPFVYGNLIGGAVGGAIQGGGMGGTWGAAAQGAFLGAGTAAVCHGDLGFSATAGASVGAAVGPMPVGRGGRGTWGEAAITTSLGGHLAGAAVGSVGAGEKLARMAFWSGAINGAYTGTRGTYNWANGSGFAAFGSDSTWNIIGTSLGNLLAMMNTGSEYSDELSGRQNRQVYPHGWALGRQWAFTQGNVISNATVGDPGPEHNPNTLHHEQTHVDQQRLAGPGFQLTYVLWAEWGLYVALGYWAANGGNLPDYVYTTSYLDNPFEKRAYEYNPEARDGVDELTW